MVSKRQRKAYVQNKQNPNIKIVLLLVVLYLGYFVSQQVDVLNVVSFSGEFSGGGSPMLYLPAVDDNGEGVVATLVVEVKQGTGKELINIDNLVFWEDTQQSIQIAKKVACDYTGIDEDSIDVTYSITSEGATVVGGPSAGAALTIATIAAIEGRELDSSIIITGTIDENGNIGTVGGIFEKASASEVVGAKLFLIPVGDADYSYLEAERECVEKGSLTYCETVYNKIEGSVVEGASIRVVEVSTVEEALGYFWKEDIEG
jgi:uncharacterized protein